MDNLVLYDWVSITSKIHSPEDIIVLLGMSHVTWERKEKHANGYKQGYYWNKISIHFDGMPNQPAVWLEMSGQGCRVFETVGHGDYDLLFDLVKNSRGDMRITRLDIAFDDHTGILPLDTIIYDVLSQNYVSKSSFWEIRQSSEGVTINIGSPRSPVVIRIYDKARERECGPGTHWVRVELQLRDDRCLQFVNQPYNLGQTFAGVVLNYLRFVVPDVSDSNRWRWPLTDYWDKLIGEAEALSVYVKPGIEYNLTRAKFHVFKNNGNVIAAMLDIYGVEGFVDRVNTRNTKPNPKYKELVDAFKNGVYDPEIKSEREYFSQSGHYF